MSTSLPGKPNQPSGAARALVDAWKQLLSRLESPAAGPASAEVDLQTLEERVMYDASPLVAIATDVIDDPGDTDFERQLEQQIDDLTELVFQAGNEFPVEPDSESESLTPQDGLIDEIDAQTVARQLVVIDSRLQNFEQLAGDLLNNESAFEVLWLDERQDGVAQISAHLNSGSQYDAIHIIGHGSDANIQLGATFLNAGNIDRYERELSGWTSGLAMGADILLYGCNVGAGAEGQVFVERFNAITGADIAASDDLTGHADLGGDWDLEYTVGVVETGIAFSRDAQDSWNFTLDISSNLVAHYEFEEGSGTTAGDSTANSNDGTLINSPTWSTDAAVGSHSLDFTNDSGGSSVVRVLDNAALDFGTGDFTASFWYQTTQLPPGEATVVGWEGFAPDGFDLYTDNFGDINFRVEGTSGNMVDWAATPLDGNWHLITATRSGSTFSIYIDGVFQVSDTSSVGSVNFASNLMFGAAGDSSSQEFDGLIDDVRIYNRALTTGDIGELFALGSGSSQTFTVTNTNDSGAGSLRQAILDANANSGHLDTIEFDISGSGPHTISLTSELPTIVDSVFIDGWSEGDYASDGVPVIVLDGTSAGVSADGLDFEFGSDNSTVRGLSIINFSENGIELDSNNTWIYGNYIGLQTDGVTAAGNDDDGILIHNIATGNRIGSDGDGSDDSLERNIIGGNDNGIRINGNSADSNFVSGNYIGVGADGITVVANSGSGVFLSNGPDLNVIGGPTAALRNVIAGNDNDGIRLEGELTDSNVIQGNYIGVSADGLVNLGNGGDGIFVYLGGDDTDILDNWIAGSFYVGIEIDGVSTNTTIQGNRIGTDATGTLDWGNNENGILIENGPINVTIGGTGAGEGNIVAFNQGSGIQIENGTTGASMRGNSIYSNDGIGIDLTENTTPDGVTANDGGDIDSGGNNLQNWAPLLAAAINDAGLFSFSLNSDTLVSGAYTVDFYASPDRNGGVVEGRRWLGSDSISGNTGTVNSSFSSPTIQVGEYITLTITDGSGNTSEFSNYAVATDSDSGGATPSDLQATATTDGGLSINDDGGNDIYLQADDGGAILGGLSAFTFEIQFRSSGTEDSPAFASYASSTDDNEFSLYAGVSTGNIYLEIDDTGVNTGYSYSTIDDGQQHTISVTWDNSAGDWELFVDGVSVANGTGLEVGTTLDSSGSLVFGNDQDEVGSDFSTGQEFTGELYDIRFFDSVRTAGEILASFRTTLLYDETNMIANWRFDQLSTDGVVVDVVNGNNLTLKHVAESGFTPSIPALLFSVNENADDGTVVGSVSGFDAEREALIATLLAGNTDLYYNPETGKFYEFVDTGLDWASANANAQGSTLNGISGQLVSIRSATENQQIVDMLNDYGQAQAYLRGSDAAGEGEWRWGDLAGDEQFWQGDGNGSAFEGAYTNWDTGNPNDFGSNQDYAKIFASTGLWDDVDGTASQRSIIEYDADEVLDHNGSTGEQPLTYSIDSQSVAGAFEVDADSGEIRVLDGSLLDADTLASHTLTVRVSDINGNDYDEAFIISLNNLVEANNAPTDLSSGIELNLDGGNDAFLVASDGGAILGGLGSVTFEAAFVHQSGDQPTFISYETASTANSFRLFVNDSEILNLAVDGNPQNTGLTLSDINDGNLHSIAVSWDNTNGDWAVYLDGTLRGSGTGLAVGSTIDSGGALVLGQEQDSVLGDFEAVEAFQGTFYDVRIWDEVRSEAAISLNYQQKIDSSNIPSGLVANWQMDGFDGSNEVVDTVSANNLSIGHATGGGFTTSNPVEDLHVSDTAANGDTVGYVLPTDADNPLDIVNDGRFLETTSGAIVSAPNSFGGWNVTQGSVDVGWSGFEAGPLGGQTVDLHGTGPTVGGIQQTLTTEIGRQYQVVFALSGNWTGGDAVKDVRVGAGGQSHDFSVEQPTGWSAANMYWSNRSFNFVADSTSTILSFLSLDTASAYGAMITDVQVIEIPEAISTVLENDGSLRYDAATGKFYKVVTSTTDIYTAMFNASNDSLNGVNGQLVTIRSLYENNLVRSLLDEAGASTAWIGATDATVDGEWRWLEDGVETEQFWNGGIGGSAIAGQFSGFGGGEPSGGSSENFAVVRASDGIWIDLSGLGNRSNIIEWDAKEVLSSFTYSLTDDANGRFAVNSSTGEITVADTSQLHFSVDTSHDITVQVVDNSGNTFSRVMTIELDGSNEAPTFLAGDGVVTNHPTASDVVQEIVQQDDGKFVSIGSSSDGVTLTRFNTDGTIDSSFGTGGRATATVGTGTASVYGGAIQADGKFIVVGGVDNESFVARFDANGVLDTTFDTDGIFTVDMSASTSEYLRDVVIQPDGRIVAVGYANISAGDEQMTIVRLDTDGSLDTTFDTTGFSLLDVGPGDDRLNSVAIDSFGRIVAVGQSENLSGNHDVAVLRFHADGSLDTTFDTDGIATFDISSGDADAGSAVAIDGSGRIVIGGTSRFADVDSLAMRLLSDGSLDTSFNGTGFHVISAGVPHEGITDLALQPDGRIVMVGSAYTPADINDVSVIRLNTDGSLDTTFDGDGLVRQPIGTATDDASAVLIDNDGDIIIAGRTDDGTVGFHLMRLDSSGQLDARFGVEDTLDGDSTWTVGAAAVVLDPDVEIYDAELSEDNDFGGSSLVIVRNGGQNSDDVFSATGNLVFNAGSLELSTVSIGAVANANGTLVLAFNAGTTNAQVNEVLQSIAYSNSNVNPPGSVQLDWVFDDGNSGAQGTGGSLDATGSKTVNILNPVVQAITVPGPTSTNEDTAFVYSGANVVQIDDGVTADTRIQVKLSVANGTLTLASLTGITFAAGADGSSSLTIEGSVSDLNTALDGLTFTPDENYSGSDTLNISTAIAADLEGHYTFETSTINGLTVEDQSAGLVQNSTLVGDATIIDDPQRGDVLSLDGDGDYLEIDSTFDQPANVTLTAWVNLTSVDSSGANLITIGDSVAIRAHDDFEGGLIGYFYDGAGDWKELNSGIEITGTGWRHVAYTVDTVNNVQRIYVDGVLLAEGTETAGIGYNLGTTTVIGAHDSGSTYDLGGLIDDARIYSRALSVEEIHALATDQTDSASSVSITVDAVNDAPTFDVGDGFTASDLGNDDVGQSIIALPDGRILVAGYSNSGSDTDLLLTRYNSDGSLDTTFGGGDGIVTTSLGATNDVGHDVEVQADGRIVVVGNANDNTVVTRYNDDGTLDTSFGGGDGIVITSWGSGDDRGRSVELQPDGKILVGGYSWDGVQYEFAVSRYNVDGTVDTSFGGGDGLVTTALDSTQDLGYSMSLLEDGKILLAGRSHNGSNIDFGLTRYLNDGTLDTSFGAGSGSVTTAIGTGNDIGFDLAVQSDGKILVAGYSTTSDQDIAVTRYNVDGSLDVTFGGGDGIVTTPVGAGDDSGQSIVLQADGKFVVAGFSDNGTDNDIVLARYNSDGTLDTGFGGGDGIVLTDFGSGDDAAYGISIQDDGKLVVTGSLNNGSDNDVVVLRYDSDGTLDSRFGTFTNTLDGISTFVEGGPSVILDADLQAFDVELNAVGDFGGVTLTLARNGGANAEDVFSATGNLVFNAGAIELSSVNLGSYTNAGGTLVLNFTAGTVTQINEVMQSIAYSNTGDAPPSSVQIDWTFNDGGNSVVTQGSGGALDATGSTVVNIQGAPDLSISAPSTVTTNEDTAIIYSGANVIQIDDGLAADSTLRVTLSVSNGWLTLNGTAGLTFIEGAQGSSTIVIDGLESNINAALDGLQFSPAQNYSGADTLTIQTAIASGLNGHYTFEGGNANDQSAGVAYDGALNGDASTIIDSTRGEVLNLDGTGDFVRIDGLVDEPEDVTLAAWINATSTDSLGAVAISMGLSPALYLEADGRLTGYYESGGTNFVFTSTESLLGTGWRHVALTIDSVAQELSLFVDGVSVGTITANLPIEYDNSPDTYIGRAGDGNAGYDFEGMIDEARIYGRALSVEEIGVLAALSSGSSSELTGRYTFDGGDAQDQSVGTAHDGSLFSGASTSLDVTHGEVLDLTGGGYVEISSRFDEPSDVTVGAWVNLEAGSSSGEVFSLGNSLRLIVDDGANGISLLYADGTVGWTTVSESSVDIDGQGWNHVAATFDDTNNLVTIYLNGVEVTSVSTTDSINWTVTGDRTSFTRIGDNVVYGGFQFDGRIDDARVYTRALTADEIAALVHGPAESSRSVDITVDSVNDAPTFDLTGEAVFVQGDAGYGQNEDTHVLADGSMLLIPYDVSSGNSILVKLSPDGSLDSTFGTNGFADNTPLSSGYIQSVTEQPDGRILVSGRISGGVFVARYLADGSIDTTFGTGGVATLTGSYDEATDIGIQSDGSIIFVGEFGNDSNITRLTSAGVLDTTFGTSGTTTVDLGGTFENLESVVVLDDDSIIAVGETSVVKLGSNGALDTGFDSDGILDLTNDVFATTVQSDGKFVVAGGTGTAIFLSRFNADGSIDTDFGASGTATWAGAATGYSVVQQSDGKLVVAGNTDSYPTQWLAVRFNANGSLDTGFGSGGAWNMTSSTDFSNAYYVGVYNDGASEKIVIGGYSTRDGFDNNTYSTVVRLNHDGSLDSTLGTNTLDGNPTYVEGGSPIVLDADVVVVDSELDALNGGDGNYSGASITISRNGGANAEDVLSVVDGNGISVSVFTSGGPFIYDLSKNGQDIANGTYNAGVLTLTFTDANGEIPTSVDVDNILRQIVYSNSSDDPAASVQLDWVFDDGNAGSQGSGGALDVIGSTTIDITAVNDTPTVNAPSNLAVDELTWLNLDGVGISFSDSDAGSSDVQVTLSVGATSTFSILDGDSGVTVAGSGTPTATLTGTIAELNDLFAGTSTGWVRFRNLMDVPPPSDTLQIVINDLGNSGDDPGLTGDGTSEESIASTIITINDVNNAPGFSGFGTSPGFTEGGSAVVLESGLDLQDPELDAFDNYSGSTVTLTRNGGVNADDEFSFNDGNGITISGGNLIKNSQVIATFDVLTTDGELVISFTDANGETPAAADVDNILQQITYSNTSDDPPASVQIDWVFDDGNTGAQGSGGALQATGSSTVNISPVNDAPVVTGPGSAFAYTEQGSINIHGSGFSIADPDDNGGTLTATLSAGEGRILINVGDSGVTVVSGDRFTSGNGTDTVTFSGTEAQLNALLTGSSTGTIVYSNVSTTASDLPSASTTVTLTVNDQGNTGSDPGLTGDGTSEEGFASQTINITSVNDAPTFLGNNLVNNGDFTTDLSGWGITGQVAQAVGEARFGSGNVAGPHTLSQTVSTTAGEEYVLEFDYRDDNAAQGWNQQLQVTVDGGSNLLTTEQILSDTDGNTFVRYRYTFTADAAAATVTFTDTSDDIGSQSAETGGVDGYLDNVSVRQSSGSFGNSGFTEGGAPAVLDADANLYDPELDDVDNYSGSILTLVRNGGVSADDDFSFNAGNGITLSGGNLIKNSQVIATFDVLTTDGELVITFTDSNGETPTATDVESIIRQITYANSSDNPPASVDIDWTFNDGNTGSQGTGGDLEATGSTTVIITGVNDSPVAATIEGSLLSYTENDGPVSITSTLTLSDIDDTSLETAEIQITGNYVIGEDLLGFTDQNGISGSWDAPSGTLTLTGTATIADYRTALRSVTYENTSDNPDTSTRTISFTVNDGALDSNTVSRNIDVAAENDDPFDAGALPSTVIVIEDVATGLDLSSVNLVDHDDNGGVLIVTLSTSAGGTLAASSGGGVTVGGSGSDTITLTGTLAALNTYLDVSGNVEFTTSEHVNGTAIDSIDFEINDNGNTGAGGGSDVLLGTISVDGVAVNDAPVIAGLGGDVVTVINDGTVTSVDVLAPAAIVDANDLPTDYDGGVLQLTGVGFDGVDQLGIDTSGTVGLSAGFTDGSVVSVGGVAVGTLSGTSNSSVAISFNANATPVRVDVVLQSFTFESTSAILGSRSIEFVFDDGDGIANGGVATSSTATVFLSVGPSAGGSATALEDTTYTFSASEFDFTGVTGNDLESLTITGLPVNGTLTLSSVPVSLNQVITKAQIDAGLFEFVPDPDDNGANYASFDFFVNTGNQTVVALAGEPNSFTLNGGSLGGTDVIIADPANFGPGGTVSSAISVAAASSNIDSTYLAQGSILFNGFVPDGSWTPGELSALDTWVNGGGILITTSDAASYDDVSAFYGLTIGGTGSATWNVADDSHEIMNGPFGLVGNNGDPFSSAGTISYFNSASLAAGDVVLAVDSVSGQPTMVLRQVGSGHILFTSDEGIFRANMTGTGAVVTPNDILAANVFSWATSLVPASTSHSMSIDVTPVNDASQLSAIEVGDISYPENSGAVNITSSISLADIDDTAVESAVIQISGNYFNGEDVLAFVDVGGISGSWDSSTGTLTLTGTDTLAAYEAALQSITYENTSDDPSSLTRTVSFTVNDGDANSNTVSRNIDVVPSNDNPVASSIEGANLAYTEKDAPTTVTSSIVISDVDDTHLESAEIQITGNYQSGEDVLAFVDTVAISGSWNSTTGTLTLTGTDTVANYQAALRTITYENTSLDPSALTRTVSFTVNDGDIDSNIQSRNIDVAPENDAAALSGIESADVFYFENDLPTAISSTISISDVDDTIIESAVVQITGNYISTEDLLDFVDTGFISSSWNATSGTLTLTGSDTVANYIAALRAVTYENTSEDPSNTTRTISFTVNDGDIDSNTVTRDVMVTPVNDAPDGTDRTVVTLEDTDYTFSLADFGYSDPSESHAFINVRITTLPANGTLLLGGTPIVGPQFVSVGQISAGDLVFQPAPGGFGNNYDTFTFQVQDGGGVAFGGQNLDTTPNVITVDVVETNEIRGTVFHDVAGDGSVAADPAFSNASVHLYLDNGNGVIDAGDSLVASTTTDGSGNYSFTPSVGAFWIVVDSTTLVLSGGFNSGFGSTDIWASQTYGSSGAQVADGSGGTVTLVADGTAFEGRRAGISDDASSLLTSEHVTYIDNTAGHALGVDSGFSFNVVSNLLGGDTQDDDLTANRTVQGSLRQFLLNANAIAGDNSMRFVPVEGTNSSDGSGNNWWTVNVSDHLPEVTDSGTTIDGTAYSFADGVTVVNPNSGQAGTGGMVGADGIILSLVDRPELEINLDGIDYGVIIDAEDVTIEDIAIHGAQDSGTFTDGIRDGKAIGVTDNVTATGPATIRGNLIGLHADGSDPGSGNRTDMGLVSFGAVTVTNNLFSYFNESAVSTSGGAAHFNSQPVVITNNEIAFAGYDDNEADLLNVQGSGAVITGNYLHDILFVTTTISTVENGKAIEFWHGATGNLVENNTIDRTITAGIGLGANSSANTIRRNIIRGSTGDGSTAGSGAGVLITTVGDSTGTTRNTISENLIYGNAGLGIDIDSSG
ncbi:MAG: LamG-like jellyroll fold domain-containing protein, partial [Planctomycetota bacterium]